MKIFKTILFLLFFTLGSKMSSSQILKDTIYIRYKEGIDKVKETNCKATEIWIRNNNFLEEIATYEKKMEKLTNSKDSLLPPTTPIPIKPDKFFKYFLTDKPQYRSRPHLRKIESFFVREKLSDLEPSKKLIYVVWEKKDTIVFYPVSFYSNTVE